MTYQTVKTLSPIDAGYLAGLIDGEGTITLSRRNLNKHRALVITVSNTEMSILKYVQEITGVGKITNKRTTKANHSEMVPEFWTGRSVKFLFAIMLPV